MSDSEKIVPLPGEAEIEADAASWLTVMGREQVSEAEIAEFHRWMKQSDRHRAAFNELSDLWDDLAILQELDDIAESAIAISGSRRPRWPKRVLFSAAAAMLLVVFAASMMYLEYLDNLEQQGTFITAVGEQHTLTLSDGSTLQLNTDSHVEVDFSRKERVIQLLRGEAYFDVAKNRQRPFYVYVGDGVVRAVGTAFTVRLRSDDEVEVTVEEGRVALASFEPPGSAEPSIKPARQQALAELTAGQSAVFGNQVEQIAQMQAPELNRKLAWRQGMLAYVDEPLLHVVNDVSRYTDITITISDPALRNRPIAGYFRVGEVDALFDSLELTFGLNVERVSDKHVRLSAYPQNSL